MNYRIPIRYFTVTFLFSWLCWCIPLLLVKDWIIRTVFLTLGLFGPAAGTFVSLRTIEGKGAIKKYMKSYLSLNFGLKVWLSFLLVLFISRVIAWNLPVIFGEENIKIPLQNIFLDPFNIYSNAVIAFVYFLLMNIFLGGGQEEIGWRGNAIS